MCVRVSMKVEMMAKCILFVLVVGMCHCFSLSKCNPLNASSNGHLTPSEDILLNVMNATVWQDDFNSSDIMDYNTTGFSIDDMHRLNFARRWEHLRERKKQQRLFIIQNRINDLLGLQRKPNVTPSHISDIERQRMADLFEIYQTQTQATEPDDISAERVQSFYPTCTLPRNTDRELWEDPGLFHMYYDIPSPHLAQSTSLTVSSAKLRLFKISLLSSECVEVTDESREINLGERLRISVFQYVRPLRRNKRPKKKKLIDSRMVATDFAGWLDFDVGSSIRDWLENSSKNLGLEVVLEDALANIQNPSQYLHNMNCTKANEPPFPRFMEDQQTPFGDTELTLFENETYPTLDLRTVEVLEGENSSIKNNLNRRRKRGLDVDSSCNNFNIFHSQCCGIDMDVSFEELGFDGIVAPKGFRTKVCVGFCGNSNDESNRADESEDKETCSASETESLAVLHYNEDEKLVIQTIPDVIVKSCTCLSA